MNNQELKDYMTKHGVKISGVIHVGAHFGQENSTYVELGINKRIFFEPLETNFINLQSYVDKEAILIKKALGNEKKLIEMFVENNNNKMSSSILEPLLHKTQFPNIVFETTETVEMDRLDDMDLDLTDINMMNIDVQGYELEVLKGSVNTLKQIDYIILEINSVELYKNCPMFDDINNFLIGHGFECIDQFWWGGNFGEGFFVKKKNI
jgi:FkbM family methyltransferase